MSSGKETYQGTFNLLNKQLEEIVKEKEALLSKASEITLEENQIRKILEALKPLMEEKHSEVVTDDNQQHTNDSKIITGFFDPPIKWKSKAFDVLKKNSGRELTSPEMFDIIYPNSNILNKEERRRKMISLSIALSDLVKENKVQSKPNDGGRGMLYSVDENSVLNLQ